MSPFNGKCEVPEQQMGRGVIVIGEKRSGNDEYKTTQQGETPKKEMRPENLEVDKIAQDEDVKVTINPKAYVILSFLDKIKGM
jgi:hypothetical protein